MPLARASRAGPARLRAFAAAYGPTVRTMDGALTGRRPCGRRRAGHRRTATATARTGGASTASTGATPTASASASAAPTKSAAARFRLKNEQRGKYAGARQ